MCVCVCVCVCGSLPCNELQERSSRSCNPSPCFANCERRRSVLLQSAYFKVNVIRVCSLAVKNLTLMMDATFQIRA